MKCFEKSGEKDMYTRARAYYMADLASKTLVEIESEKSYMENNMYGYGNMKKHEKKIKKRELIEKEKKARDEF
jgi:hypothetical protein